MLTDTGEKMGKSSSFHVQDLKLMGGAQRRAKEAEERVMSWVFGPNSFQTFFSSSLPNILSSKQKPKRRKINIKNLE